MKKAETFYEILQQKILFSSDFQESKVVDRDIDPFGLAYLMGDFPKQKVSISRATILKKYPSHPRKALNNDLSERNIHQLSPRQKCAYDFFNRERDLSAGFTQSELRKTFRTLARQRHPDHGGSDAEYMELRKNFEILKTVFIKNPVN